MCFSAHASFAAGAALLPAGVYCVRSALRKDTRYTLLALVPVVFGIQQVSEGFVWLGLEQDDAALVRHASVMYLFLALAFWPCWIALSLLVPETRPRQKKLFALLAWIPIRPFWPKSFTAGSPVFSAFFAS